jgi:hypothetical protein
MRLKKKNPLKRNKVSLAVSLAKRIKRIKKINNIYSEKKEVF